MYGDRLFSQVYFITSDGFIRSGVVVMSDNERYYIENYGWIDKEQCYDSTIAVNTAYLWRYYENNKQV